MASEITEMVAEIKRERLQWGLEDARNAASWLGLVQIEDALRKIAEVAPKPEKGSEESSTPDQPVAAWHQAKITTEE